MTRVVGFTPAPWLARFVGWLLDPAKRKAFYGILGALGTLLVLSGVATDSAVTGWVGVVAAVLDLLALALGMVKAQRLDVKALYVGAAVVLAAAKVVGLLSVGQEAYLGHLINQALAIVPMVLLFLRTDTTTPTGEPASEYQARHTLRPVEE